MQTNPLNTIHELPQGGYVLGEGFSSVAGVTSPYLTKLDANGIFDPAFRLRLNGSVEVLLVQNDGSIIVAGNFNRAGGSVRNGISKFRPNGSLDEGFDPNITGGVRAMVRQSDGRILIAGSFTYVGGVSRPIIARLNVDGTLDRGFEMLIGNGFSERSVDAITFQPNGDLVIGGLFSEVNGQARSNIARVNANGVLDPDFQPTVDGRVSAISLQADGKLLIGGDFSTFSTAATSFIRLMPDGFIDPTFGISTIGSVSTIVQDKGGRIVVDGSVITVNGTSPPRLIRFTNDPAESSVEISDLTRIRWLRGGSFPEADFTQFEVRETGDSNWTPLGNAIRVERGWELDGLTLPDSGLIRAKTKIVSNHSSYYHLHEFPAYGDLTPKIEVVDAGD